jgi:hypothetical protein
MEQNLTNHAKIRCRQRGVRAEVAPAVLKFGDIEMPSYGGCRRLQLSHGAVDSMLAEGVSIAEADAAKNVALIVDASDRVVTVLKIGCDRRVRTNRSRHARKRLGRWE